MIMFSNLATASELLYYLATITSLNDRQIVQVTLLSLLMSKRSPFQCQLSEERQHLLTLFQRNKRNR